MRRSADQKCQAISLTRWTALTSRCWGSRLFAKRRNWVRFVTLDLRSSWPEPEVEGRRDCLGGRPLGGFQYPATVTLLPRRFLNEVVHRKISASFTDFLGELQHGTTSGTSSASGAVYGQAHATHSTMSSHAWGHSI
jgi:hypothetical protein